jgi:hypothetical protein
MDVCVSVRFSAVLCRYRLCSGPIPHQKSHTTCPKGFTVSQVCSEWNRPRSLNRERWRKQVRKRTHSVTILARSPEFHFWPSQMPPVTSELSGWLGIPQVIIVTKVTAAAKTAWGFPAQSLPRVQTHVAGLYVKCSLLLSDFNHNWSVSTKFNKSFQYQISWKSAQPFSSCYMRTDRQTGRS